MNSEKPLNEEFADYRDTIIELKVTDSHFRRLLGEYEHVEDEIVHGGEKPAIVAGSELEQLRKHQRSLREHLLQMIRCAEPMMMV